MPRRKVTAPFLRSVEVTGGVRQDAFPFTLPAVRALKTGLDFHPKVTFLIGENGSGKSTLVEAIAAAAGFNPEGGTKNLRFSSGAASESGLREHLRLVRTTARESDGFFLRAESFFDVATTIDRLDREAREQRVPGGSIIASYGGKSLHAMSHGESFLTLVRERFHEGSLFILDEPEAALSPQRQLTLLAFFDQLVNEGASQMIVATHSPILMAYPEAWIYELSETGIRRVDYESTEHYRVTRDFLDARERFFRELFRRD